MAHISIDLSNHPLNEEGIIVIWWWKEKDFNQQLISTKPIWKIFNSEQTYLLTIGETIEVKDNIIIKNFEVIQ